MSHDKQSRRSFLNVVGGLAASAVVPRLGLPLASQLAGLAALASQSSHAAETGGYKALVCLYMNGGSDTHNWVVPIDASGYTEYSAARSDLAIAADRLQPITVSNQGTGRSFGMPVELAALRQRYESGQVGIVANVGPLQRPITKADFIAGVGLPSKLFSHNDQASTWQSLAPEGARSGWGGRLGDIFMSANAQPVFTAVSAAGNAVFLTGSNVSQFQVGTEGPVTANAMNGGSVFYSNTVSAALRRSYATTSSDQLQNEYSRVMQRSLSANSTLQSALANVSIPALPATTIAMPGGGTSTFEKLSLSRQLRVVLQLIAANQALGMRRQVFMVSMGGFDTHAFQMRDQPAHMAQVSLAIDYFLNTLSALGLQNNVTLFTASDFGRTLSSNGDGSDHGWGSHHFVAGGAVKGRQMYGRFPVTAVGTNDEVGSGRLLPSTSVSQLAGSLAGWMGLSSTEISYVLPNISSFGAGPALF